MSESDRELERELERVAAGEPREAPDVPSPDPEPPPTTDYPPADGDEGTDTMAPPPEPREV